MLRGTHDNWEKLVGAVLEKEELRRIAHCESLSSSISDDFSSRFSFNSVNESSGTCSKTVEQAANSDLTTYHGAQVIRFRELKKATKNFHHGMLLGEGAFGPMFKGWINERTLRASRRGSGMVVAVRKWMKDYEEYEKEIKYLSQLRHPNLVKLIGCCSEEDSPILVYEFVLKGSLDNHLFTRGRQSLYWATRMKVAIGVARALSFLHDLTTPVIHRGCQCSNIYLDKEFDAKLSDFSLARGGPIGGMTHVSTRVVGTYGVNVVAPEYVMTGCLTEKFDVFSFGVVLLELLSGRGVVDMMRRMKDRKLIEWAETNEDNISKMLQIMDNRLDDQYPRNEAYTVAKLACRCLSRVPEDRPRMAEVVLALQQLECPQNMERETQRHIYVFHSKVSINRQQKPMRHNSSG